MQDAIYSTLELRTRAVKAVRGGMTIKDVADAYRVDRSTLHRWLQRFRDHGGKKGLVRRPVSGRPRKMTGEVIKSLKKFITKPASRFGFETDFWTAKRLYRVLKDTIKLRISTRTIVRRLHDLNLSYKKPERQYFELSLKERKKWLEETVPQIRETIEKYRAILYCEDEANVSLSAVLAKTWSPVGKTIKQRVTGKRGGIAAMSAISAKKKLVFVLHEKRITSREVIHFLEQLLKHHKNRHLVVIMDRAPPHTSKMTKAFIASQSRLHEFYLPSYSPDWNPDEKVWNHLKNQELKGHQAKTVKELKSMTRRKLNKMKKDPDLLNGIFFRCCIAELLS